ncbi:MAG: response regulator [Candidatus Peribacteria bacterium]|nr:MAG: response regulator [Candidatus Peribacteria bacterium]
MPKVLLVEDNREISESVAQYLHMEGYEVDTCFDGVCALEKGVNPKYDIILLDVMLPEIDGFRVAQKLIHKAETPMIMITAKESIEDKLTGFESGAVDYLVKPFDLRELVARIQSVLGRSIK